MLNKTKYIGIIFSFFKNNDYETYSENAKTTYQLAVLSGILTFLTFGFMSFFLYLNEEYFLSKIDFLAFIIILGAVFTIKYYPKPFLWINAGIVLSSVVLFIGILNSGGAISNFKSFLNIIPMVSVICLPWRQVLFWTTMTILQFLYFLGPHAQHQNLYESIFIWQNFVEFITHFVVILFSISFTYFFRFKLKKNNSLLNEKVDEISLKNEELNTLIEEIKAQKETLSDYLNKVSLQKTELEKNKIEIENINASVLEYVNTLSQKNQELNNLVEEINTQKENLSEYLNLLAIKNAELEDSKLELKAINYSMIDYTKVITKISKLESIRQGILDASFNKIVEQTSICTKTSFVSILSLPTFEFKNQQKNLFTFHLENYTDSESQIANIELYKENLKNGIIINSNNFKDKESISISQFIKSFIYFPIVVDNNLVAVLCCENIKPRNWEMREIVFFKSICQLISMTFVINQQKKSEAIILKQNIEIEQANNYLEIKIKRRTAKLLQINAQLSEFAFMHAHVVRANVCRILGLGKLIEMGVDANQVTTKMVKSAKELDSNMKDITAKINEFDSVMDEDDDGII